MYKQILVCYSESTLLFKKLFQNRQKTKFAQGDACNLPENLGQFGVILAANLVCRLHSPREFLHRLAELVAPGGILVITAPYTWLQQFSDKVRDSFMAF